MAPLAKPALIFLCLLSIQPQSITANVESENFTKVLSGAKLANSSLLEEKCSGTPECSLLNCARMCAADAQCLSYGYGKSNNVCEFYTIQGSEPTARSSAVNQSGWDTWDKDPDPCDDDQHSILQEDIRSVTDNTGNTLQDLSLQKGWYRFKLHDNDAQIPTTCRQERYYCGSYFPMWLDLQGASLPADGAELEARACGGGNPADCCDQPRPVIVRNCGTFFVYELEATENINYNYCTE